MGRVLVILVLYLIVKSVLYSVLYLSDTHYSLLRGYQDITVALHYGLLLPPPHSPVRAPPPQPSLLPSTVGTTSFSLPVSCRSY
ncbi:hypothetical protein L1987_79144 [Smallanthus sonchifolius]|uniref:Uncharacterized protein n=1 Tax=Smallanthus sonchifolius TaxID=185202 RepID=A0ACB8ZFP6_9ASTR|nr:hypothetical protein L1987_79144 [Smallanthus sonchifolius]